MCYPYGHISREREGMVSLEYFYAFFNFHFWLNVGHGELRLLMKVFDTIFNE